MLLDEIQYTETNLLHHGVTTYRVWWLIWICYSRALERRYLICKTLSSSSVQCYCSAASRNNAAAAKRRGNGDLARGQVALLCLMSQLGISLSIKISQRYCNKGSKSRATIIIPAIWRHIPCHQLGHTQHHNVAWFCKLPQTADFSVISHRGFV